MDLGQSLLSTQETFTFGIDAITCIYHMIARVAPSSFGHHLTADLIAQSRKHN